MRTWMDFDRVRRENKKQELLESIDAHLRRSDELLTKMEAAYEEWKASREGNGNGTDSVE